MKQKEEIVREVLKYLYELRDGGIEEIRRINSDENHDNPESVLFLEGGYMTLSTCIIYLEREYLGKE